MPSAPSPEDPARSYARAVGMLRGAHQATADLLELTDTAKLFEAVVSSVPALGFSVAVLNVVRDDGTVEVTNVHGPGSVHDVLLGVRERLSVWEDLLEACEDWGALRFMSHEVEIVKDMSEWVVYTGEIIDGVGPWFPTPDGQDETVEPWHPEDSLFAPIYDKAGVLLAVLCVDLPVDGRRPGPVQREMLALFAGHVRVAIENARLHEDAVRARQELERKEGAFRLAFDAAPTGIAMVGRQPGDEGRLLRVNGSLCALLDVSMQTLLGSRLREHLVDAAAETRATADEVDIPVPQGEVERTELAVELSRGDPLWLAQSRITVHTNGSPFYDLIYLVDISAAKAREHSLEHDARHDPLTGLANRRALHERIQGLALGQPLSIVFVDIDDFKTVNDSQGHDRGDELLINVARRISSCVRTEDLVVRYGGDEFVVIAEGLSAHQSGQLLERIEATVSQPMSGSQNAITITATCGLATDVPHRREDAEALLARADHQMLEAKGRSRT